MIRDPFYKSILQGLAESLDGDTFERCAQDLLRTIYPNLTPVEGGRDLGMDGLDTLSPDDPLLLASTTGQNVKRNLVCSLRSHKRQSSSIAARRVVVATSEPATGSLHEDLRKAAYDEDFQLVNLHGRQALADLLYRSPMWTRELLGLSGAPPALSAVPLSSRLQSDLPIIGRDADVQWLSESSGDIVVSGHPASGKTHLLRQFVDHGWLFLVDPDRERIANDVREKQPAVVILDDAHGQLKTLRNLKQWRTEVGAGFRIAAVTWPGDTDNVLSVLDVSDNSVLDLPLLSRDEILNVVKAAGIGGGAEIQRSIVNQSGGHPGLAATLCDHALRGDLHALFSGRSLLREIKTAISAITDPTGMEILAVMALAANDGASLEDVSKCLELDLPKARDLLVHVGHTGVLRAKSLTGRASIWPRELRYAIVGAMFFSANGYQNLPLEPFVNQFGERRIASSLVGAALLGGEVPSAMIQQILIRGGSADDFAQYSRLGSGQAQFALRSRPEWLTTIAPYSLETNPAETLQSLLWRAGEDRPEGGSDHDHPLGIIKRWIESAPHRDNLQLQRREVLASTAKRYLADSGDPQAALDALCMAMSPKFESVEPDAGSGLSFALLQDLASRDCLDGLVELWPAVLDAIPTEGPQDWSALFDMLDNWAYCAVLPKSPPPEIRELMRGHAARMAVDLADRFSQHPGVLRRVRETSCSADLGVDVGIPDLFATLHPIYQHLDDFEEEEASWSAAARRSAADLEPRGADEVLPLLLSARRSAAETGITWPDETLTFTAEVAARAADPLAWAEHAVDLGLEWAVIEPLLRAARTKDCKAALPLVLRALNSESAWPAGVAVVLTVEDRLEMELEATLDLVPQFMGGLATLVARKQVPEPTLRWLLAHPSPHVAETTAASLWRPNGCPRVPDDLVDDWRAAMLRVPANGQRSSRIFEHETDLFAEWLLIRIRSGAVRDSTGFRHRMKNAFNKLSDSQRLNALAAIPERDALFSADIVSRLVGDNAAIFKRLLDMENLKSMHEAGFGPGVSNEKIKAACAVDWQPDRIVQALMFPMYPEGHSGNESDLWRKWLNCFEELAEFEDPEIAAVGHAGSNSAHKLMEDALRGERKEAVFGIDA